MPKSELAKKKTNAATQQYLNIAEVRDNVLVLKDGSLRAALLASSVNFALKSEEEQNAIIQSYIAFLNSLDFPIQIVVQSRRLNMDKYLEGLVAKQREQTNELLRTQIAEYREYIQQLVTLGEIMSKRFYLVVPLDSKNKGGHKGFFEQLGAVISPATVIRLSNSIFQRYVVRLESRVDKVVSGLGSLGVTAVQLDTQSLIELLYSSYNPELSYSQKLPEGEQFKIDEE